MTYGSGAGDDAQSVAALVGILADPQPDPAEAPGHLRVTLGLNYTAPPDLDPPAAAAAAAPDSPPPPLPDSGLPLTGQDIPCVD